MVEFGLKLSDNKVADWSESYIRYEKLKQILKKCETDQNRYNDLASRNKAAAEAIRDSFGQGMATPKSSSASLHQYSSALSTDVSPSKLSTIIGGQHVISPLGAPQDEEQTTFLPPPPPPTTVTDKLEIRSTSDDSGRAAFATESSNLSDTELLLKESSSQRKTLSGGSNYGSVHSVLEKATSSVSGYFWSTFEHQVRDALKAIEKDTDEFGNNLAEDLTTVNTFYEEKLYEIQGRLRFLKDTVAQSRAEFSTMAAEASAEARTSQTQAAGGQTSDDSSKLESGQNAEEFPDDKETPLMERRKSSHSPNQLWRRASAAVHSATMVATNHHRSHTITPLLRDSSRPNEGEYELPGENNKDMKSKLSPEDRARLLREAESTQRALVDLYRTAKLLHNFAILNFTGFIKIVKKFNKTLPQYKGRFKQAIKPENVCDEGTAVEALADRMVLLYANWFCHGSKSEAQVQIMPKRGDSLEMDWTQLRVGYRMGMCTILGLWVAWDCVWGLYSKGRTTIGERDAFPVFRACGGLLLLQWFWGVSVWVWTRFRINYIYLFDFNPHIVDSPMAIFNAAVDHTLFYLINMLLYYKAGTHDIPGKFPQGVFPFFLVVYACLQLVIPVRTRLPMWGSIWRVVTAPAYSPSFFQGYLGDIFTSMVKVFQDMAWTAFFIFSGDWMVYEEDSTDLNVHHWSKTTGYKNILIPLLTLLPLWFRFNQCLRRYLDTSKRFPHLANAFKYALAQTVTLFGAFHPLYLDHTNQRTDMAFYQRWWMLLFIGSSLYSFTWDVYMDWGLGLPKFNMLGPRLMFPNRAIYYAIISADLVLRFAWVLTLIPPGTGAKFALPNYLAAVSMILELGRRTVWGFLRLENEHRSNTAGYRRVNFVPLHFTTGHKHDYSHGKEHRGIRVLLEVAFVTLAVLAACVVSVVAAQHATDLSKNEL